MPAKSIIKWKSVNNLTTYKFWLNQSCFLIDICKYNEHAWERRGTNKLITVKISLLVRFWPDIAEKTLFVPKIIKIPGYNFLNKSWKTRRLFRRGVYCQIKAVTIGRQPVNIFEKLNDWQLEIRIRITSAHVYMNFKRCRFVVIVPLSYLEIEKCVLNLR